MATVFFPGKFQPVHLGHVLTLMSFYETYDKIIIGVTEDGPDVLTQDEIKDVFEKVFKYLPKFEVVLINGTITNSNNLDHLPKFDLCLTGNKDVIRTLRNLGLNVEFMDRSEGLGFSGTDIRSIKKK